MAAASNNNTNKTISRQTQRKARRAIRRCPISERGPGGRRKGNLTQEPLHVLHIEGQRKFEYPALSINHRESVGAPGGRVISKFDAQELGFFAIPYIDHEL